MKKNLASPGADERPGIKSEHFFYDIKVQGQLGSSWTKWFEGMSFTLIEDPDGSVYTLISGQVVDQPALHGLLNKIRDLNLSLISVQRHIPCTSETQDIPINK